MKGARVATGLSVYTIALCQKTPAAMGCPDGVCTDRRGGHRARSGRRFEVAGTLPQGFVIENERVLVKLQDVSPLRENDEGPVDGAYTDLDSAWVDIRELKAPETLVLRSEVWEIPDDKDREVLLRSLAITLARQASFQSHRIDLARQFPDSVELLFYNAIAPEQGAAYQASFAGIRIRCHPRPLPWLPPTQIIASKTSPGKERYESHVGHLPLWLQSRRLWSAYLWDRGRFLHVLQFSLSERLRSTIVSRFKLTPVEEHPHRP